MRLDLDRFVPYRLSVLTNGMSDAIARHYSERFGLTIPEWRVMAVLGQTPGLSAREVAARTAMDKVQVSRAVANLLRRKRVTRIGDAKDGRVSTYTARDGLSNDNVLAILEDREGNLWVGTQDGGLNRFSDSRFVTWTTRSTCG